jgi:hypothetical protein
MSSITCQTILSRALTSRHIVDPRDKITYAGFLRQKDSTVVSSPALADHIDTKEAIAFRVRVRLYLLFGKLFSDSQVLSAIMFFFSGLPVAIALLASPVLSSIASAMMPAQFAVVSVIILVLSLAPHIIPKVSDGDFGFKALHDAETYDIKLGTVSATSGPGNFDWALIPIALDKIKKVGFLNKVFSILALFDILLIFFVVASPSS